MSVKPSRLAPVFDLLTLQAQRQTAIHRTPDNWVPTHRHRKGGLYRIMGHGTLESDRSAVTIYDDTDGQVWVRPTQEFEDGRFEPLD